MNDVELTDLSQLCDGELDNQALVEVLLRVLDSSDAKLQSPSQRTLGDLLRLRQATAGWRASEGEIDLPTDAEFATAPAGMSVTPASLEESNGSGPRTSAAAYVAATACAACLLLLGFIVGQNLRQSGNMAVHRPAVDTPANQGGASREVPSERRRQIAEVFAFHESVAGPLNWYAAGDDAEDLAVAVGELQSAPVGLVLRFTKQGERPESREFVIVCRDRTSASIQLPGARPGEEPVQVRLKPTSDQGEVELQYSVVLPGAAGVSDAMGLAGRRAVGAHLNDLGEFAFDAQSIRVEASAWLLDGGGA